MSEIEKKEAPMTKEEFQSIIKNELKKLKEQLQLNKNIAQFLSQFKEKCKHNGIPFPENEAKELEEAKFQIAVIEKEVTGLENFIGVELIERIKAYSNAEVDDTRKILINEEQTKLDAAKESLAKLEKDLEYTKNRMVELKSASTNAEDIDKRLKEYGNLLIKSDKLQSDINELKEQIENSEKQLRELPNMAGEQIKEILITKELRKSNYNNIILRRAIQSVIHKDITDNPIQNISREQKEELLNLMNRHNELRNNKKTLSIERRTYNLTILPYRAIEHALKALGIEMNDQRPGITVQVDNYDALTTSLNGTLEYIQDQERVFDSKYSLDNLKPLVGITDDYGKIFTSRIKLDNENYNKSIEYFRKQEVKDPKSPVDEYKIEADIAALEQLMQNFREIKGKPHILQIGRQVEKAEKKVREKMYDIYKKIYDSYFDENCGFDFDYFQNYNTQAAFLSFSSIEAIERTRSAIKTNIELFKEATNSLLKDGDDQKRDYEKQISHIEGDMHQIEQEIDLKYGGKVTHLLLNTEAKMDKGIEDNFEDVITIGISLSRQGEVLKRVRDEAVLQADAREAELNGYSLEELRELRQKKLQELEAAKNDDTQYGDNGGNKGMKP